MLGRARALWVGVLSLALVVVSQLAGVCTDFDMATATNTVTNSVQGHISTVATAALVVFAVMVGIGILWRLMKKAAKSM